MMTTRGRFNRYKNQGAVLITTLSFLVLITLIGLTAMGSSTNELQLASNYEDRVTAIQVAQAAIDATISEADDNFVVTGNVGTVNDTPTFEGVDEFAQTQVIITERNRGPFRRQDGSSLDKFSQVTFTIDSAYNGLTQGRGQAHLVQGYAIKIAENSQSNQ